MSEITLTCTHCHQQFVFTEGEQQFYREKGLSTPTLCLICRARQKAEKNDRAKWVKKTS